MSPSKYRLLTAFEDAFRGKLYKHRDSSVGNIIAAHLYEDLFALGRSDKFRKRVESQQCVVNVPGNVTGIKVRRPDGTFGERNPSVDARLIENYQVARGQLATIEIGIEVKILAKAMIKQIDRVINDLTGSVQHFRKGGGNPVSVGIVGINNANRYVSFEGTREYPTTGSGGAPHPIQEAKKAAERLTQLAKPSFDEFLILSFDATNEPPFPFSWVDPQSVYLEYGAFLARVSRKYDLIS